MVSLSLSLSGKAEAEGKSGAQDGKNRHRLSGAVICSIGGAKVAHGSSRIANGIREDCCRLEISHEPESRGFLPQIFNRVRDSSDEVVMIIIF